MGPATLPHLALAGLGWEDAVDSAVTVVVEVDLGLTERVPRSVLPTTVQAQFGIHQAN